MMAGPDMEVDVAHPQMFDDDDPRLLRLRELALALPDAAEKVSHGRPAFFTTKVFAYFGTSLRVDGEWVQHPHHVVVQPDPDERAALLQDDRTVVPAYLGPAGWLGVLLPPESGPRSAWAEIAELLDASYRRTAGPRRVARLDRDIGA